MGFASAGFQIQQLTHGATDLGEPAGGWVREIAEFETLRAGTIAGPIGRALTRRDVEAEVLLLDLADDVAAGTKATLTFTLKEAGGGTAVVTVAGMKRAGVERDFRSAPHLRRVRFRHEGELTTSPLSVTV